VVIVLEPKGIPSRLALDSLEDFQLGIKHTFHIGLDDLEHLKSIASRPD
jgi:hypothetical protein